MKKISIMKWLRNVFRLKSVPKCFEAEELGSGKELLDCSKLYTLKLVGGGVVGDSMYLMYT